MAKKKKTAEKAEETKLISEEMEESAETAEEAVEEAVDDIAEETAEDVSRETNEAEEAEGEKLWSAKYVLNDKEIENFVNDSGLVESKKKTYIQAGLAALLCLVNLYSYTQNHRPIALILVLICAALCGAILIVPLRMRKQLTDELKAASDEEKPTRLASDGEKLYFGAGEDTVWYAYKDVKIQKHDSFLTLLLGNVQMICVPERAVPEEAWEELCSHAATK